MSNEEADNQAPLPEAFDELARSVLELLEAYGELEARADVAEERVAELEATVRDLSTGSLDPVAMGSRLETLEEENDELQRRMGEAHERVRRVMARLDFIREEQ